MNNFNSPIENKFYAYFSKFINKENVLMSQYRIDSPVGFFLIDFVICHQNYGFVGFECDGKDFHDEDRDEWRDAAILGFSNIDTIFRIRGCDIKYNIYDVLYVIYSHIPKAFSKIGKSCILKNASYSALKTYVDRNKTRFYIEYNDESKGAWLMLRLRSKKSHITSQQMWMKYFEHLKKEKYENLDNAISSFRKSSW